MSCIIFIFTLHIYTAWDILALNKVFVYMKFKFNWTSCFLLAKSGNPPSKADQCPTCECPRLCQRPTPQPPGNSGLLLFWRRESKSLV